MGFAFDSLPKAVHAVLSGAAIFPAAPFFMPKPLFIIDFFAEFNVL